MTEQTAIPDPFAYVRELSGAWLAEVAQLRDAGFMPSSAASPARFREALEAARARLDRLETILRDAVGLRGLMRRGAQFTENARAERWDQVAAAGSRNARDFEGTQERYARFNLECLDETRTARQWKLAADEASDLAERIRIAYQGLRDVRGELIEHLRYFVLESNLDR